MDTTDRSRPFSPSPASHVSPGSRPTNPVLEKVQESAQSIQTQAKELASDAAKKADQVAASAGRGLENMAEGIHQHSPLEGIVGEASQQFAASLRSTGQYLENHGVSGLAEDVTDAIRRNPVAAVFVALGIGFVFARASSGRR